ncbi:MAG TPA: hypothetical protein VF773_18455 [Verrucomicrobiae bacterium]
MTFHRTRRGFLADVGRGVLTAAVGAEIAGELGLGSVLAEEVPESLSFGSLERLVCLMQETPADRLLPALVAQLRSGTDLRKLTAAAALANARTFGGEDYVGFHTLMALSPAYHMSQELPAESQALPVLKVLYRNTSRIQEKGGRKSEVLHPVAVKEGQGKQSLRDAVRSQDMEGAEATFARLAQGGAEEAFNQVLQAVHDETEVHRVVLPYRAWDLLDIVGREHAHTLLRQSVRYCVKAEAWPQSAHGQHRVLLPKLMEEHHLVDRSPGTREPDDAWMEQFIQTLFKSTAEQAAVAAATALAEGIAPAAIGEAISLTANQLILRDHGRPPREESPGKPPGSVHGDSIGVHASDSANAWRNMARVANARNAFASLILGAYQVAHDRTNRGGDFVNWEPLPVKQHLNSVKSADAEGLLRETEEAIRANMQGHAAAIVHRYGAAGHSERPMFDLLLKYAVSEDGSLHAEKYYRTVSEEFRNGRAAYRWRHLIGLARVTASEYGRPAAGMAEARSLLRAA